MRAIVLAALLAASVVLPAVSHAESLGERQLRRDKEYAEKRCIKDGLKPGAPEMDTCVRDKMAWLAQNRVNNQRNYTQ